MWLYYHTWIEKEPKDVQIWQWESYNMACIYNMNEHIIIYIACGYCSADYSDGVRQILIPIEWVQGKKFAVQ